MNSLVSDVSCVWPVVYMARSVSGLSLVSEQSFFTTSFAYDVFCIWPGLYTTCLVYNDDDSDDADYDDDDGHDDDDYDDDDGLSRCNVWVFKVAPLGKPLLRR